MKAQAIIYQLLFIADIRDYRFEYREIVLLIGLWNPLLTHILDKSPDNKASYYCSLSNIELPHQKETMGPKANVSRQDNRLIHCVVSLISSFD